MGMYNTQELQYGSKGSAVKEWQRFLQSQGYAIDVDGIFGKQTRNFTRQFQGKNGLATDGIVGKLTWGLAGYSNPSDYKPTSAPKIDPAPGAPTFNSTNFDETTDGATMKQAADDALADFNSYGGFEWANKGLYDGILNDYLNRDKFSYDLNGDALYQQYKDKYIQQGKMAMQDTMGQASAMTGGYGSSYAQSVGQQAYQNSLDNLNDIVPELYQMAYDRYNQEGADMLNQIGVLDADHNRAFGEWEAGYNVAKDKYSTNSSAYYSAADLYNTNRDTANDLAQADYTNKFNAWTVDNDNAWKQANFEESQNQFAASHALNERQVDLKEDELNLKKNSVGSSGGSGSGSSGGSSGSGSGGNKGNTSNTGNTGNTGGDDTDVDIESELNFLIKKDADKSEINNYLREAYKAGYIGYGEYTRLKELYAPRGYTYGTGGVGGGSRTTVSIKQD